MTPEQVAARLREEGREVANTREEQRRAGVGEFHRHPLQQLARSRAAALVAFLRRHPELAERVEAETAGAAGRPRRWLRRRERDA